MAEIIDLHEKFLKESRDLLENGKIGDGVTACYYTDRHAYTIIGRTAKTLRIQRDKATLSKDFKPEFIIGGFAAHCTNNNSQRYDYAKDPDGVIKTAYWSEVNGCFRIDGSTPLSIGRHEFYDYNY